MRMSCAYEQTCIDQILSHIRTRARARAHTPTHTQFATTKGHDSDEENPKRHGSYVFKINVIRAVQAIVTMAPSPAYLEVGVRNEHDTRARARTHKYTTYAPYARTKQSLRSSSSCCRVAPFTPPRTCASSRPAPSEN